MFDRAAPKIGLFSGTLKTHFYASLRKLKLRVPDPSQTVKKYLSRYWWIFGTYMGNNQDNKTNEHKNVMISLIDIL